VPVRVLADQHHAICEREKVVGRTDVVEVAQLQVGVVRPADDPRRHLGHVLVGRGNVHLVHHAAPVLGHVEVAKVVAHLLPHFRERHVERGPFGVGQHALHLLELGSGAFGCGRLARLEERSAVVRRIAFSPGDDVGIRDPRVCFRLPGVVLVDPCFHLGVGGGCKLDPSDVERLVLVLLGFGGLERARREVPGGRGDELEEHGRVPVVRLVDSLPVRHDGYVFVREPAHGVVLERRGGVVVGRVGDLDVEAHVLGRRDVGRTQAELVLQDEHRALAPVAAGGVVPQLSVVEVQLFGRDRRVPGRDGAEAVDPGAADAAEVEHLGLGHVPALVRVLLDERQTHAAGLVLPVGEEVRAGVLVVELDVAVEVRVDALLDEVAVDCLDAAHPMQPLLQQHLLAPAGHSHCFLLDAQRQFEHFAEVRVLHDTYGAAVDNRVGRARVLHVEKERVRCTKESRDFRSQRQGGPSVHL